MSVKEKIIDESIQRIEKRISEIDSIIFADPLSEIIELRQEAQKRLDEARENGTDSSDEFLAYIKKCSKKEKELFKLAEKQQDTNKLLDEKSKLKSELSSLHSEKHYIEMRK